MEERALGRSGPFVVVGKDFAIEPAVDVLIIHGPCVLGLEINVSTVGGPLGIFDGAYVLIGLLVVDDDRVLCLPNLEGPAAVSLVEDVLD
jgi:hypothetical protein